MGFFAKLTALSALPYYHKTSLLKTDETFIKVLSEILSSTVCNHIFFLIKYMSHSRKLAIASPTWGSQ